MERSNSGTISIFSFKCQQHLNQRYVKWDKHNKMTSLELVEDSTPSDSDSDQPIDMSLSSRKRALSPDKTYADANLGSQEATVTQSESTPSPKKFRPTRTLIPTSATAAETRRKKRKPLRNLAAVATPSTTTTINKNAKSALIISPEEYSDEGINNHFRRSLSKYLVNTCSENGFPERWEVWCKLLKQAKPLKEESSPSSTPKPIRPTVLVLDKK